MHDDTHLPPGAQGGSLRRDGTAPAAVARPQPVNELGLHASVPSSDTDLPEGHTLDKAFIEELVALQNAEPLSDDELERQALEHPGADGDPATPE